MTRGPRGWEIARAWSRHRSPAVMMSSGLVHGGRGPQERCEPPVEADEVAPVPAGITTAR
jgi:hypothetical protein